MAAKRKAEKNPQWLAGDKTGEYVGNCIANGLSLL
jgi:hypothetical protein